MKVRKRNLQLERLNRELHGELMICRGCQTNSGLPFAARDDVAGSARVAKAAEDLQCRYSEVKYWATTSIGWSLISRCLIRVRQCGVRSAPRRWTISKASMM